jgi:hypothetical protein
MEGCGGSNSFSVSRFCFKKSPLHSLHSLHTLHSSFFLFSLREKKEEIEREREGNGGD